MVRAWLLEGSLDTRAAKKQLPETIPQRVPRDTNFSTILWSGLTGSLTPKKCIAQAHPQSPRRGQPPRAEGWHRDPMTGCRRSQVQLWVQLGLGTRLSSHWCRLPQVAQAGHRHRALLSQQEEARGHAHTHSIGPSRAPAWTVSLCGGSQQVRGLCPQLPGVHAPPWSSSCLHRREARRKQQCQHVTPRDSCSFCFPPVWPGSWASPDISPALRHLRSLLSPANAANLPEEEQVAWRGNLFSPPRRSLTAVTSHTAERTVSPPASDLVLGQGMLFPFKGRGVCTSNHGWHGADPGPGPAAIWRSSSRAWATATAFPFFFNSHLCDWV